MVVVTGGFHRPALIRLAEEGDPTWPELPEPPADAVVGSYLVPYSFRRLDAFDGYQSGMPSPAYYQHLWESGPGEAARRAHRGGDRTGCAPAASRSPPPT